MNPAFSVIFFTVTAGTGYGLLILLALSRPFALLPNVSPDQVIGTGLLGLALVTAGLVSSTFHLANPKNAWRSFTRFRTSWLSREAVFAVLFYPLSLAWLLAEFLTGASASSGVLSVLVAILALVVLVCTAMIYASLKTIRQWHHPLVPINFVLLSLLVGTLVLLVMGAAFGLDVGRLAGVGALIIVVAATIKLVYFVQLGQPGGPTINTAIGFTKASVRLLDVGHSGDTFHTREFGFQVDRARIMWLRVAVIALAFALPLLILFGALDGGALPLLLVAAVSGYVGVFVERWLFFAEARHVVNLYHGAQQT